MVELSTWFWESLYTVKQMYDHDCADDILKCFGDVEVDGDMVNEIACTGIEQVFADTRDYYNQEEEIETLIFFDSIITKFYQVCAEYEQKKGISAEQNPFRADMERAINSGFSFNDYSYGHAIYTDPKDHSGCKLVLFLYPEFCSHYAVPSDLLDIRDAFINGTERLRRELEEMEMSRVIELPATEENEERKAA